MRKEFIRELENTGYVHRLLPLHAEESLEAGLTRKTALERRILWKDGDLKGVTHTLRGKTTLNKGAARDGGSAIEITAPLRADAWPDASTGTHNAGSDGRYQNFGTTHTHIHIGREDWSAYNRIAFFIRPDYPGGENVHLIASIKSDGDVKIPDVYHREGYHVMNLANHAWNHMIWEFQDMPRDAVTEIDFYLYLSGNNGLTEETVRYYIDEIALERVATPDHALGWRPAYDAILYSTAGYDAQGVKQAIINFDAENFCLKNTDGESVFSAKVEKVSTVKGEFGVLDFSEVARDGAYTIEVEGRTSEPFWISRGVMEEGVWKTLNYLFAQRCGHPVPGVHEACHRDSAIEHNGVSIVFNGGWHDAGDLSQFTHQSIEIMDALFEMASKVDKDSQLYHRLMEEGEWGLDFAIRTRFGDGYRVSGIGAVRFTDGLIGNFDDVGHARVTNHPMENFIAAAALAHGGMILSERDYGRGRHAIQIARQDYAFAMREYELNGCVLPERENGHLLPSGESQFYAFASVAASYLYQATGEERYAADARDFADHMLLSQETGREGLPVRGFFYRDANKVNPQHFNHQSRESYYMRALVLLCRTQKEHPRFAAWEAAMRLYAGYLKDMMRYIAPYGMAPSGVYSLEETRDKALFGRMNPGSDYARELPNWQEQIKMGQKLNDTYYVRCYPVWFSFRGNAAVQLESGKAAGMLGRYFGDEELVKIAREQIYWIWGKNPSGQSIMYGMGRRYCQMYGMNTGEITGQLPVGMESYENEDTHYWPQGNNATYKEVWTSPSRSYLWVMAEIL